MAVLPLMQLPSWVSLPHSDSGKPSNHKIYGRESHGGITFQGFAAVVYRGCENETISVIYIPGSLNGLPGWVYLRLLIKHPLKNVD